MNNKQLLHQRLKQMREGKYPYELAVQQLQQFIQDDEFKKRNPKNYREALTGVYHRNKELISTNAYVLFLLRNVRNNLIGTYLDGEPVDVPYPITTVEHLIQWKQPKMSIFDCSVKEWLMIHKKAVKFAFSKSVYGKHVIMFDGQYFCAKDKENNMYFREQLDGELDGIEVYYNAHYMLQVLESFNNLGIEKFTFEYHGKLQPMRLLMKDVLVLLLPVRVF